LRVKVTYTVDSEEVLSEVQRLINSKLMNLKPVIDMTAAYDFEKTPIVDSLELVDQLRKQLFDLDTTLLDVDGILRSYAKANFSQGEKRDE
tara:strand:+ start:52388 stop:52660 length:273 start_codon:yes stop_codon:yes gene_type:complete